MSSGCFSKHAGAVHVVDGATIAPCLDDGVIQGFADLGNEVPAGRFVEPLQSFHFLVMLACDLAAIALAVLFVAFE